jgi:hypothetical protein
VTETGDCKKCDDFYITTDAKTGCEPKTCEGRQSVTAEGQCEPCAEYFKVSDDGRSCIEP